MEKRNRIYADTSVFGGIADKEFESISKRFFEEVREGKHELIMSDVTAEELRDAPETIRLFIAGLPEGSIERVTLNQEMVALRDAYLAAKVVGRAQIDDAAHVAVATVMKADVILSWNFKHLVKWSRIRRFNAVNLTLGYPLMTILSPREVVADEEEA
jgi:predicted nucleic acid-binding protein